MDLNNVQKAIDSAFLNLMKIRPFFGAMASCMNVSISKNVPSAGVTFDKKFKKVRLLINPEWWMERTPLEQTAVLIHECEHILQKHIFDYNFLPNKMVANMAMDIHINQRIENLPAGCLHHYNFEDKNGTVFPADRSSSEYYDLLMKEETKYRSRPQPDQAEDESYDKEDTHGKYKTVPLEQVKPFDEHDWDSLSEEEKMQITSDLLKRSLEKQHYSHSQDASTAKDILNDISVQFAELDYKKILEKAVKKSLPTKDRESTWFRPNKRYGYTAPGSKAKQAPKVDFYIDSSGSMSVEEINFAFSVVDKFLTVVDRCKISLFHTSVYKTENYKKGKCLDKSEFQIGGTDLTEVMRNICTNTADLSIIITDGYYSDVEVKPVGKKVLFLITQGGNMQHPLTRFGESVALKKGVR